MLLWLRRSSRGIYRRTVQNRVCRRRHRREEAISHVLLPILRDALVGKERREGDGIVPAEGDDLLRHEQFKALSHGAEKMKTAFLRPTAKDGGYCASCFALGEWKRGGE